MAPGSPQLGRDAVHEQAGGGELFGPLQKLRAQVGGLLIEEEHHHQHADSDANRQHHFEQGERFYLIGKRRSHCGKWLAPIEAVCLSSVFFNGSTWFSR